MHPAFRLVPDPVFSQSLQIRAAALCAGDATLEQTKNFSLELSEGFAANKAGSHFRLSLHKLVLPVAYTILDPASLSSFIEGDLGEATKELLQCGWIMAAWLTADCVRIRSLAKEAALELWPRVWSYLPMFERHCLELQLSELVPVLADPFPTLAGSSPKATHSRVFLSLIASMTSIRDVFLSTAGVLRLLVSSWRYVHELEPSEYRVHIASELALLIADRSISDDPRRTAEIMDGAGGIDELAHLMILHADAGLRDIRAGHKRNGCSLVTQSVCILNALEPPSAAALTKLTPLAAPLGRQGLVRVLSQALELLVDTADENINALLPTLLHVLCVFLTLPPGHLRVAEAIQHHLPQTVLCFATKGQYLPNCHRVFDEVFSQALIRVDVLAAFKSQILELESLAASPAFRTSPLLKKWEVFYPLLQYRLQVVEKLKSGAFPPRKMCDNIQCRRIAPEAEFKRCSGCQSTVYCGAECQTIDWRTGGHKKACASFRIAYLHESEFDLTPNDKDFIRALMDTDFDEHAIYSTVVFAKYANSHPGEEIVRVFDYGFGAEADAMTGKFLGQHPVSEFGSVRTAAAFGPGENGQRVWAEHVRRAQNSKGRIELDFVRFSSGCTSKLWFVPRRVQNSLVPAARGVREDIVRRVRSGDTELWSNLAGLAARYVATVDTDEVGFH